MTDVIPHYDITLPECCDDNVIAKLVKNIRKTWNIQDMKFKTFTGTSNQLVGCYVKENDEIVLVRRYGQNDMDNTQVGDSDSTREKKFEFVDREREISSMKCLHTHGLASKLYCTFNNGYCHEYLHGNVLTLDDLKDIRLAKCCVKLIAKLHSVPTNNPSNGNELFRIIRSYLRNTPISFNKKEFQDRYVSEMPTIDVISKEVDQLEASIQSRLSPQEEMVFCHNDISSANLIYHSRADTLHLIDYEFCFPNHPAYDVGNLFTEFAGVDGNHYERYPDETFQKWWINTYLQEKMRLKENDVSELNDDEVHHFYVLTNHYALASHLFWITWAILKTHFSNVNGEYYLEYAIRRMKEYYNRKKDVLNL